MCGTEIQLSKYLGQQESSVSVFVPTYLSEDTIAEVESFLIKPKTWNLNEISSDYPEIKCSQSYNTRTDNQEVAKRIQDQIPYIPVDPQILTASRRRFVIEESRAAAQKNRGSHFHTKRRILPRHRRRRRQRFSGQCSCPIQLVNDGGSSV